MSRIRANQFTDKAGTGAPTFPNGVQITGVSTLGNTVVGGGTTQLVVNGNARITGILTIGTSSITLDGSSNQVNVGTGVTLHHTNGVQVGDNNLHSTVLTVNQINASGVSTFSSGIVVAAGSTAAPSITPTGDSDTGIFFPSADTIAFGEGGSEAARIDSSGRLLLGTSSTSTTCTSIFQGNASGYYSILLLAANTATPTTGDPDFGQIRFTDSGHTAAASIICSRDGGTWTSGSSQPTRLTFSTTANGASSPTEAMRINNQRELLIGTSTRTANGGVLQISNGITFPATQSACSDANTLDDYEEGSFTPSFSNGGNGTYLNRIGRYTKIGNTVTVHIHIQLSSVGTASGNIQVSGLPFTSKSVDYFCTSTLHGNGWNVTRNNLNGIVPPSSTNMDLYYNTGGSISSVQHSDVGTGNLLFSVTYLV